MIYDKITCALVLLVYFNLTRGESGKDLIFENDYLKNKSITPVGRFYSVTTCNYQAEPGYMCIGCKRALHCYPTNLAILVDCNGVFRPYCYEGHCSPKQGSKCVPDGKNSTPVPAINPSLELTSPATNQDIKLSNANQADAHLTEANEVASQLTEASEVAVKLTEGNEVALKIAEANEVVSKITEASELASDVTEANEVALKFTEANEVVSKLTETDEVASMLTDASEVASKLTEANEEILKLTEFNEIGTDYLPTASNKVQSPS